MSLEDKAQEHEAKLWLLNNRPRDVVSYKAGDKGYGPEECQECGADMRPERRAHGFTVCVPCKSAAETRNRWRR